MKKGYYVTLEGPEGSGKTTQVNLIDENFKKKGIEVLSTREPGGTDLGKRIRNILLDPSSKKLVSEAELLLYCADRAQHIGEVVRPALKKGKFVLSDRGPDATLLYQGYARGLDLNLINKLNSIALGGTNPDLTIFVVGEIEYFLERAWESIEKTGDTQTRFEQEKIDFHKKIMEGVYTLAKTDTRRYTLVEDNQGDTEEVVNKKIMNVIYERLNI